MAENPNDKVLRDKLQSAEYAYDPAAWADMEQLLDQKKRRGFLWWWLSSGAVAVALLVSAGVYYYPTSQVAGSKQTLSPSAHLHESGIPVTGTVSPVIASSQNAPSQTSTKIPTNGSRQSDPGNLNTTSAKIIASSTSTPIPHYTPPTGGDFTPFTKSRNSNKKGGAEKAVMANAPKDEPVATRTHVQAPRPLLYADDYYGRKGILLDSESPENTLGDNGEGVAVIPARHRHHIAISYSLGVEAGGYASYARKTFSYLPTWSLGLAQQVNIGKYLAITNSILYSEVNFKINDPAYPINPYNELKAYNSHIRELAIPIGVKVYPYSSRIIRLGIGIAYVNHIKLDEKFTYHLTPKVPPTSYSSSSTQDFPGNNNFNPSSIVDQQSLAATPTTNQALMEYYSLGNGRRYYGSLLYTVGIDIMLPHHISISVDPAMRMSIGKIKMQDSRVFDFGMNAGLKYTF